MNRHFFPTLLGLLVGSANAQVVINEIFFDPPEKRPLEFVELHNAGPQEVALAGWKLDKFTFPAEAKIAAGGFAVVASVPELFEKEFGQKPLGKLSGKLSNEGEKLTLRDAKGTVMDVVKYGVGFPWPTATAGRGSSLERVAVNAVGSSPGNWRASGFMDAPTGERRTFIPSRSPHWHWRRGTSEASQPAGAWRVAGFAEDKSWATAQAGFGYGDGDDTTVLGDMAGKYSSIFLRHGFTLEKLPSALLLRARVDDGFIAWVNGVEVARRNVPGGDVSFDALAGEHEAGEWEDTLIADAARLLKPGVNVLAVQVWNSARDSSDLSADFTLATPDGAARPQRPTPGAKNSVAATAAPPACYEVVHRPRQPAAGAGVMVTATFAPNALSAAALQLQAVEPGAYIRRSDAEFSTRWATVPMRDDGQAGDLRAGDGVWSALIPGAFQSNRRLVRYTITATGSNGATLRLPYADDPSPNFAYFVWNGPPAWTASAQPGKGEPLVFSSELQKTLPTFTVIANADDVARSQWDGGADARRFAATFVHDGVVHDHIEFSNRGSASTHVSGKNKWKFHFLDGHDLAVRDADGRERERGWNSFSLNACASPWVQINRGMTGLDEVISARAFALAGVPTPDHQPVQLRVVTGKDEMGRTQFDGDQWGVYVAIEDLDGTWLDNHRQPKGIIWKPEDGLRYQPGGDALDPGAEWEKLKAPIRGDAEKAWRERLDVAAYASFHAINRFVSNVDLRHGANHAFYQHPERGWQPVPWDLDMQFIPRNHQAGVIDETNCLSVPAIHREYQARAREILDLLGGDASPTGGQIGQLVADYARRIAPPAQPRNWAELDMCRWNFAPRTNDKGAFFRNPAGQGMQGGHFERRLATPDFAGFCRYVVEFCTDARPEKNYAPNDANPLGYGWGHLAHEARDAEIPARPSITQPVAGTFRAGAYQGKHPFAAIQWRIGEIGTPAIGPWRYELPPVFLSAPLKDALDFSPPPKLLKPGGTYRIRARYCDATGRWSRWSEAIGVRL